MEILKRILIILIILSLGSVILDANKEPKDSYSLKEACKYALNYNNQMKNAKLDIDIAKKKIWETTAMGLPQINGNISYQNMLDIPTTLIPARIFNPDAPKDEYMEMKFGIQHNASYQVSANQLIFQGSYFVALQASKVFLQLSTNALEKTRINVKESVSNTYYLVLLSLNTRKNLEENLKIVKKIHYETSELNKAGFLQETDVDQIKITLLKLQYQLDAIKRQIKNTSRLLKFQMGLDLDQKIYLTDDLDRMIEDSNYNQLMNQKTKITQNINYRILDTQEQSSVLLLKKERSEYLPNISAFFSYTNNAMRNLFNFFDSDEKWFPTTVTGINIDIPLFTSGMKTAKVKQAKMELKKIKNQKNDILNSLKLSLSRAKAEFATAFEQYISSKENLKLAKRIFEKTKIRYQKGMASSLELSQIHNQYLSAQAQYLNGMYNLLSNRLILLKELNQL